MIKLYDILFEVSRYKKETSKVLPNWQDKLKEYEQSKDYFVHFSNVPRAAIYIVNKYQTPIGFFAYPLDFDKMKNFAVWQPYAVVFKIKPTANILDLKNYGAAQYSADLAKLRSKYEITDETLEEWVSKAHVQSYGGYIWNITRLLSAGEALAEAYTMPDPNSEPRTRKQLSPDEQQKRDKYVEKILGSYIHKSPDERGGGKTGRWTMILYKVLGYDGVMDDCLEIIHHSEPCQSVFFNTNVIDIKDIIEVTKKIETKDDIAIVKANYANQNLAGNDLSKQNLSRANMVKTNLSNADMSGTNLSFANLRRANLAGANLEKANLSRANLTNANLEFANLTSANLREAVLTEANLAGAKLFKASLYKASLSDASLLDADLKKTDLHGADLHAANLNRANLYFADLGDVNLSGANLTNANLIDTDLTNANLSGADLHAANLEGADLRGAIFTGANLMGALYNKDTVFSADFDLVNSGMKSTDIV